MGLLIGGGGGFLLQFVGLAMGLGRQRERERDTMGWVFCEELWWC